MTHISLSATTITTESLESKSKEFAEFLSLAGILQTMIKMSKSSGFNIQITEFSRESPLYFDYLLV